MLVKPPDYRKLPPKPGIYLFLGDANEVLYIGKAKSLKDRVGSYFAKLKMPTSKTQILVSKIKTIKTITVASEIEALILEANYIKKYKPKYNTRLTDGKAYPLIRITIKDTFPKVLIARRTDDKNSIYFGHFPNSYALRLVLRTVRKIFPYQSVLNHPKKHCLYYHLNLCPCPEVLDKDTPYPRSILIQNYKRDIRHLIAFLNGKTGKVIKDLEKERNMFSKNEEFEKAFDIQKKIDAIAYITTPVYTRFEDSMDPNLIEKKLKDQLTSLKNILSRSGLYIKTLKRIECFDISNFSGKHSTGSMVVFINGEKNPSFYRRFKVRSIDTPNDLAMMQQVIYRRLKHVEWQMPDLIIVDGGKGQVFAALKAMKQFSNETMDIPVIGLAKREETIVIPLIPRHSGEPSSSGRLQNLPTTGKGVRDSGRGQNDDRECFIEVSLPKSSPALHLLMHIRDEAHRFAIQYHRKLRSKSQFT